MLCLDVKQGTALRCGNHGARHRNGEAVALALSAARAAGPACVNEVDLGSEIFNALHQEIRVVLSGARHERCTEAGTKRWMNTGFGSKLGGANASRIAR